MPESLLKDDKGSEAPWGPGAAVGVIGGHGEMGRLFARFFEDHGYRVTVADRDTLPGPREVVEASDMVLFAVPLHLTESVMSDLVPSTRPGQLLMDLSSLKAGPVKAMLRSPASVAGLHPMFGGRIASLSGQTIIACPVRIDAPSWARLRALFVAAGLKVKETTPEEHDRMMCVIQALFHMTTMLAGRVLRQMGVNVPDTLEYASPHYRVEINMLGRMFAQSPELYSAIVQMNPFTGEILSHLKETLSDYGKWYETERLSAFTEDFRMTAESLGDFCVEAFRESAVVMDSVIKPLPGR